MSIKYTYKGTEHNIDGNTTVLTTSGKYLEDNITIETDGGSSDFVGIPREVTSNGVFDFPIENFTFTLPSNAKDVSNFALRNAFQYCTSLTSADLSSLSTISTGSALLNTFQNCTSLTSVDLSNLSTISGGFALRNAFRNCTGLKELSFPALTSSFFGTNNNQFNGMLAGVTGCTVHFPSNLESIIGSWSSVTSGFDGTNTTVLFDLPATT